jgi:hypothetical protein
VEHGDAAAKTPSEPFHELGSEGNFRDQDQGTLPGLDRGRNGLEVNLGLAASGDAVEEKRGEYSPVKRGDEFRAGCGLMLVEDQFLVPLDNLFTERVPVDLSLFPEEEAQFHKPLELWPRFAELSTEFGPG